MIMINTLPKSLIEAATRVITPDTHIDVDGEMKHKYNSEGKLIHHTDDGIKNFHRWFGDSKAVDEQGRPQVVYHGTPHDFDKFDKNKIGDGYNRFGSGFYFTGDKKTFDVYSSGDGGNVKPAYLSIKNPQTSSAMSHDQIHNFFSALQDKKFDNGYDATVDHERIKQHALSEPEHAFERLSSSNGVYISKNDWHRGMKSAGIDGVIQNVFKKPEYVVHNPNQIKSAIGNNGSYDITNDSINESIEDPLEFHTDNPGGEWLQYKQQSAREWMQKHGDSDTSLGKGFSGAVTGYFNKPLNLPVQHLSKLPGAMGEEQYRGSTTNQKMKNLESEIGSPDNFDSKKYPIFVAVNHMGHAYVMEGNHRLEYARKNGISHIHTEVRYFNGGETADKLMHPSTITKLHKESTND